MKFSINSKILASALSAIVRVVDPKATMLILQNFKFTLAADGMLTIKGMSAEAEAQMTIETTDYEGADEFCVNARQLTDFIKKLGDCGVTFAYGGLQLEILAGKGKFVIPTHPGEHFPTPQSVEGETITIPAQILIDGLSRTKFAVSTDEYRQVMQGVYMDIAPDKVVFVATDTRVLTRYTFNITTEKTLDFIIPQKIVSMITALFAKSENVTITLSDKSAMFKAGDITLVAALLNGRFPDYNRVIRNSGPFSIEVDKKNLTKAVERVHSFGDTSSNLIKISVGGMFGELKVSAANNGLNTSGNDYIPCETGCSKFTIGLNADYLLSVLASLQNEAVVMSNITEGTASMPIHFVESGESKEFLALLMPMTLTE